ncbi:hypothetical protein [Deinococcus malanensis]|uniref:hypothetical protein n=1 Tax=Deinococcus malanensis TaxID=1706855 RepID=UPI001663EEB7|nr:hypothetical protein [Deinococcus malanensis]
MNVVRAQHQKRAQHLADVVIEAIRDHTIPGAVLAWGDLETSHIHQAFGAHRVYPLVTPAQTTTLYDVASLTKVVATWPLIAQALDDAERGQLGLGERKGVSKLEFKNRCASST